MGMLQLQACELYAHLLALIPVYGEATYWILANKLAALVISLLMRGCLHSKSHLVKETGDKRQGSIRVRQ